MSELKRCPFCGGEAEIVGSAYKRILCKGCEIEIFITEETVKKWNMRKPMQNIVERLEEELELTDKEKRRCVHENPLQFDEAKGYARGIANAIEIVREEGGVNE